MNFKRISILTAIIGIVIAIVTFCLFGLKVATSVIYGASVGYFNFYYLHKEIMNLDSEEIPDLRRVLKKNRNFRFLVMGLCLIVAGLLHAYINLIAVCFSVLIPQLALRIDLFIIEKEER